MEAAVLIDKRPIRSPAEIMAMLDAIQSPSLRASVWAGAYMTLHREYVAALAKREKAASVARADCRN